MLITTILGMNYTINLLVAHNIPLIYYSLLSPCHPAVLSYYPSILQLIP